MPRISFTKHEKDVVYSALMSHRIRKYRAGYTPEELSYLAKIMKKLE